MKRVWLLLLCLTSLFSRASDIPEPVIPAGVGVNIHFVTGHEDELDLIQSAGFKFVRMDFSWTGTERTKGTYDWHEYEQLLDNLDKRGLRAILILDYSHPLYEASVVCTNPMDNQLHTSTAAPQHPESIAAFVKWAAAGVEHFRGRHVLWEIWNEPNIEFWSPHGDAGQYATLALAVCKSIRSTTPDATIIGPATSQLPWDFLETVFKAGVLEYFDAVSVHPYRRADRPPESAAADFHRLRELIERYAPESRKNKIPILSGEWGYASSSTKGVSLETQAAFAVRQQLSNLLEGVPLSIWYDWKNDGDDPAEREHNFGTVLSDLKPKPAYLAIQIMIRQLAGYRIARRLPLDSDQDYAVLCTSGDGPQKIAAWTLGDAHAVQLGVSAKEGSAIRRVSGKGEVSLGKVDSGKLALELTQLPQYITLDGVVKSVK
jgi:hypothetical protein